MKRKISQESLYYEKLDYGNKLTSILLDLRCKSVSIHDTLLLIFDSLYHRILLNGVSEKGGLIILFQYKFTILFVVLLIAAALSMFFGLNEIRLRPFLYGFSIYGIAYIYNPKFKLNDKDLRLTSIISLFIFLVVPIFSYYAFRVNGFDFSVFDWMTAPKNAFTEFGYEPIHSYNHFSVHSSWILIPIYFLRHIIEHPIFLCFLSGLIIWSAVIPLFYYSMQVTKDKNTSYIISYAYLFSSFTSALLNSAFRIESFYPFFIFCFALFFEKKQKIHLIIITILFLSVKEDAALYISAFSFFNFITTRSFKSLFLSALLITFFIFQSTWLRSYLFPGFTPPSYLGFWSNWGSTPKEIIISFFLNPIETVTAILKSGWWRVYGILLFIPFFGGYRWIFCALPGLILLGTATSYKMMYHYATYYPILLACTALLGCCDVLRKQVLFPKKMIPKKLIETILLLFPLFHASTLTIHKPKLAMIYELKIINTFLEKSHFEEVCAQAILIPHLSKKIRLRSLAFDCIENSIPSIVADSLDPFPFDRDWLSSLKESEKYNSGLSNTKLIKIL